MNLSFCRGRTLSSHRERMLGRLLVRKKLIHKDYRGTTLLLVNLFYLRVSNRNIFYIRYGAIAFFLTYLFKVIFGRRCDHFQLKYKMTLPDYTGVPGRRMTSNIKGKPHEITVRFHDNIIEERVNFIWPNSCRISGSGVSYH